MTPSHSSTLNETSSRPGLSRLRQIVAAIAARPLPPGEIADGVAAALRQNMPGTTILTEKELQGSAEGYTQTILHAEPGGAFSIVALVWRAGQATPIHDHVSWCVVGVIAGTESNTLYELVERDDRLVLARTGEGRNPTGSIAAFAPPGDLHSVQNVGDGVAVSIHVYGADINRLGSSVRRVYDLPVVDLEERRAQ